MFGEANVSFHLAAAAYRKWAELKWKMGGA